MFTLEVDFSGLCLYVVDPDTGHVAVLMPDCRARTHVGNDYHEDRRLAEPHVGYVRMNLADLGVPLTPPVQTSDTPGEPRYEVVHRFDRQVLQFVGSAAAEPVTRSGMEVPDFEKIAPELELLDGLFTEAPPSILLTRMVLDGGELQGRTLAAAPPTWTFSRLFNPNGPEYSNQFASYSTWTRRYDGDTLTLRITDFAGAPEAEFTLGPVPEGGTLHLDVANLCRENPLEWSDLPKRQVIGDDEDFRWLYRLLRPGSGTYGDRLLNASFPIPDRNGLDGETADDDCMGGTLRARIYPTEPEQ